MICSRNIQAVVAGLLGWAFLTLPAGALSAQEVAQTKASVSGYVVDAKSGERLAGVILALKNRDGKTL